MDRFAEVFELWDFTFDAVVFFHATEAVIDFVERPDIEVLNTATKLTFFIKEIDGYTTNRQMRILLKEKNYIECKSSLYWYLTVLEVFKLNYLVKCHVLREVDLKRFLF